MKASRVEGDKKIPRHVCLLATIILADNYFTLHSAKCKFCIKELALRR